MYTYIRFIEIGHNYGLESITVLVAVDVADRAYEGRNQVTKCTDRYDARGSSFVLYYWLSLRCLSPL